LGGAGGLALKGAPDRRTEPHFAASSPPEGGPALGPATEAGFVAPDREARRAADIDISTIESKGIVGFADVMTFVCSPARMSKSSSRTLVAMR
jgi:hypothetical protein